MKGEKIIVDVDLTDTTIDYNCYEIKSYDNWSKRWILGKQLVKSGQSSIYRTKEIGSTCGFSITKVYHIHKREQSKQILQEYALIERLNIFRYWDIAYGKNENEIMITMDTLNYTLHSAVTNKCDNEVHDFERVKSAKNFKYFILEIAASLFQLHRYGYAHLDLKPSNCGFRNYGSENIYIYGNGWKLIDFGIAKDTNINCNCSLNKYIGTIGWSSPEMSPYANKDNKNKISIKSDIWSFGLLILYILNKGENIFHVTKEEIIKYNLNDSKSKRKYFYDKKLFGENKECQSELIDEFISNYLSKLRFKKKVENGLYHLLSSMLVFDPSKRISACQIIKHPYFSKYVLYHAKDNSWYVRRNNTRFVTPGNTKYKWLKVIYDSHKKCMYTKLKN